MVKLLYKQNTHMNEEILDLVDDQDQITGQLSRREIYEQRLHNYRVFHGFVVNKEGNIWIPRRTATKKIYPNALDYSVAGHVEAGESYQESFFRETSEELNIDLRVIPWRVLGKLTPNEGSHCFQMVYEITLDSDPDYNTDDYSDASWMSPQEIIDRIEGGELAKTDIVSTIKRFYL